jgi:hypothetical protein
MSNEIHNSDSQTQCLHKTQLWNKLVKAELGDSGVDLINAEDWSEEQPPEPNYKQEIPKVNSKYSDGEQSYGDDNTVLVIEAEVGLEGGGEADDPIASDQSKVIQCREDAPAEVVDLAFPQDVNSQALKFLASRYALINLKSKVSVVDKRNVAQRCQKGYENSSWLISRADAYILMSRTLAERFPQVDARVVCNQFMRDARTTLYHGVEFNPKGTTEGFLNLWIGHTIKPVKGDWELLANYLRYVICSNNQQAYEYLINYLAHALQKPEEKPGVMVILQGKEGTGKGTLAYLLSLIWNATFMQVHNIADVLGNFTDSLETSFCVFLDEAFFVGDAKSTDRLKGLVTEPRININPKNQPVRSINSCHRFFAATNAKHFAKVSLNNRRDVFLEVADGAMGRHEYWIQLRKHIDEGGAAALAYDLLYERDISAFNVRVKPDTEGLTKQKIKSLEAIPAWWQECLQLGESDDEEWKTFLGGTRAIELITKQAGRLYKTVRASDFYEQMAEMCPSAEQAQPRVEGVKIRGLKLPTLEIARAEFEAWFGAKLTW